MKPSRLRVDDQAADVNMQDTKSWTYHLGEYKTRLERGAIQQSYRGLMQYMPYLRNQFQKNCPDYEVSGIMYFGYKDMTCFEVIPGFLKERKLEIAEVFLHVCFCLKVGLLGYNRQVQD